MRKYRVMQRLQSARTGNPYWTGVTPWTEKMENTLTALREFRQANPSAQVEVVCLDSLTPEQFEEAVAKVAANV